VPRLAVLLCLLVLAGCGGSDPPAADEVEAPAPTTEATTDLTEATTTTTEEQPDLTGTTFQLPSRNIGCFFIAKALRCDILSGLVPEPTGECELDWGGLVLERSGPAEPSCAGDTAYDTAAPVLAYGQTWSRGRITCESRRSGLRCANQDGRGFKLARAGWSAF
jgi:hypothetical protein